MSTYFYNGLIVNSNFTIPELPYGDHKKGGFLVRLESPRHQLSQAGWSHHWCSGSEQILSYCKNDTHHWLRFPRLADFKISSNVKEITCYPVPTIPRETLRHLFLDQVLPRCLAHQGKIIVHASAVLFDNSSILFLGDSGSGKSTLAGNFHQVGNFAISDDCLWIKNGKSFTRAVPSYGGLRLWEDSLNALFPSGQKKHPMAHYSSKKRVPFDKNEVLQYGKSVRVLAMFLLSPSLQNTKAEVTIDRLTNREAFIALINQSFLLDVLDIKRINSRMRAIGRMVTKLPSYCLSIPHNYDLLPLARKKILETVSNLSTE